MSRFLRSRNRLSVLLTAAAVLAAGGVIGVAGPAAAHDELLATDPADGAVVSALPDAITFTFSGELLGDGGGSEVQVTAADGTALAEGPAIVDGTTMTQALDGEASGAVTVLWRVVSSDGHPISGQFAFTVDPPVPAPTESTTTASSAPATPSSDPTPEPVQTPEQPAAGSDPFPWILGGIILVAVIAVVVVLLVRPRRTTAESEPPAER